MMDSSDDACAGACVEACLQKSIWPGLMLALLLVGISVATVQAEKKKPQVSSGQNKVGMTSRVFRPKEPRNWRGDESKELRVTIWYPAVDSAIETPQLVGPPDAPLFEAGKAMPHAEFAPALGQWPLILLSHGTGGSAIQMAWLGTALARAGFIAVAVNHPGNNSTAALTAEGFVLPWERATDLSDVLDGMLADPELGSRIDSSRVGAAGFSIGGYTVLELAGARTDIGVVIDLCHTKPDAPLCSVPEMKGVGTVDQMEAQARKTSRESLARSADSFRDARVKAVFAIAPALGIALTQESLRAIRVPVDEVVGAADPIAPAKDNADWIRANGHGVRETVLPGGVGHYTFLDTCTAAGKQQLGVYCEDAAGVSRDAVHAQVAGMAVEFFDRALRWP
jgi:predicted dienelactone hydrolase